MDCPGCHVEMAEIAEEDQVLKNCTECGGLWLDVSDLNRILLHNNMPGLETLGGKVNAEALTGQCTECQVDLINVHGGDRHHPVHYDTCESCGGVFLESGFQEVTDFQSTVKDIVTFFNHFSSKKKVG